MLNPTVGMELRGNDDNQIINHHDPAQWPLVQEQARQSKAQQNNILDREFASLPNGRLAHTYMEGGTGRPLKGWKQELTASTRNSEVLPAFCKPIIVTSISVALKAGKGRRQG